MTIDSGWVRVFKEQVPQAFAQTCPFRPKVAYIDGMPLLMLAEGRVQHWSDFLRSNFARSITRYFRLGCEAVVLAFDDYDHVPKAKAITQANRAKAKAAYDFGEGQQLPATVPHKYNEKLTNRAFKRKVIDMICNCILDHVSPLPLSKEDAKLCSRKFVIDYSGCPIQFTCPLGSLQFDRTPVFLTDLPPLGEADIKYLRWAQFFQGNIIAFSVDGDFIPIALIHHEKLLHHCGTGAASEETPYNIALYRIRYKPPTPSSSSAGKKGKGGQTQLQLAGSKRKSGGELVLAPAAAASVPEAKRKGREYEYVDITRLYRGLRNVLSKCGVRQATHELHYMRMLSVLVGLSGTDFSRNLPHVGPTTMWSMLLEGDIFSALVRAYDPSANGMRVEDACNMFVARVYSVKFETHLQGKKQHPRGTGGLRLILDTLKSPSSKLSDKTKRELPSYERVDTTLRNINWLLQYWLCRPPQQQQPVGESMWDYSVCYPDPISAEFGFRMAATGKNEVGKSGSVQWMDTGEAAAATGKEAEDDADSDA